MAWVRLKQEELSLRDVMPLGGLLRHPDFGGIDIYSVLHISPPMRRVAEAIDAFDPREPQPAVQHVLNLFDAVNDAVMENGGAVPTYLAELVRVLNRWTVRPMPRPKGTRWGWADLVELDP